MITAPKTQPAARKANQPIRSPRGGLVLMVAAPLAALAAFLLLLQTVSHTGLITLGGLVCLVLGSLGYDIGKRMRLPDGWTVMARDPRPPVVYLRPFAEDDRMNYDAPVGTRRGGVDTAAGAKGNASHERAVARALRSVGPLVAIGKPGERVAPFGAARIYVGDDEWRETVMKLLKKAALVVLQPEASEGTWWELNAVAKHVDARRVLMLVPDPTLRPRGYERVRRVTAQVLPVALPESPGKCDAAIFDDDARPIAFPFGRDPEKTLEPFITRVRKLAPPAS